MPAPSASSVDRLPFSQLGFSRLFIDYCSQQEDIAPYYSGDFRNTAQFQLATQRVLKQPRNREILADVLIDQNTRWGLSEASRANIEHLRNPESVAVITGQQLGLFLSPLFIPYKTLTTILLAKKLTRELKRPVVPVFWLAGEDHDFEEVADIHLPGDDQPLDFRYMPDPDKRSAGPVGRMKLGASITTLLDDIEQALPPSEYKKDLLDFLRTCYRPGVNLQDAFAALINKLFEDAGLVLVSIDDERLKHLCKPLFRKDISDHASLTGPFTATSETLDKKYHNQVQFSPTNLFLMDDDARIPIDAEVHGFHFRGTAKHSDEDELLDLLEKQPERLSPNVILRPITQDLLFPTIAYVAGPGETSYYAQCKPVYEWAGIPMPLIYPRASITLLEPSIAKILDRYDIPLGSYKEQYQKLFRSFVIENMDIDLDAFFDTAVGQIEASIETVRGPAVDIDPTLEKTAGALQHTLQKELIRFKERIIKAQKRKQQIDQNRLRKARHHLYPHGVLQERSVSPLYFLNKYGLDFFKTLMNDVSLDTTSHQVIRL